MVTVSIGVAAFIPSESSCAKDLIASADSALYSAKRLGRNRALLASTNGIDSACSIASNVAVGESYN